MSLKLGKRQQKSERNKKHIFDCAIALFREHGYHSVSVEDIVSASDTSVGTFYYYFKSKEEIPILYLKNYAHTAYEEYEQNVLDLANERGVSASERLFNFILFSHISSHAGGEEFLRIAMSYLLREETGQTAYKYMLDPDRPFARMCKKLISEGQKNGEFRTDRTVDELFSTLSLFSNGIDERWYISRGSFSIEKDYSDVIWEFIQRMMLAK